MGTGVASWCESDSMSRLVPYLIAALLSLGTPALAIAQSRETAATDALDTADGRSALVSERQRLRGELERVNAEIDSLKRSSRVQDDYRLRRRMADAEALARRL